MNSSKFINYRNISLNIDLTACYNPSNREICIMNKSAGTCNVNTYIFREVRGEPGNQTAGMWAA